MLCCHCKEEKEETDFYRDKSKPSGFKPRCKKCEKLSINIERRRAYEKEYWSGERKEKKAASVRRSMAKHADKYKERRKEYLKTEKGLAMHRRQTQKRYALKKEAFIEDVDPYQLYEQQKGICYLCNCKFEFKEMECDHVVPLSRGGMHEKSNCKMACARCNRSKGAKLLEELTYQMV
jgi:5-methylcytosine-specific restriction endonuclease McrA